MRSMGMLYKKNRKLSPAALRFIEMAQREIPKFVDTHIPRFQVRHDIDFSAAL